MNFNLPTLNSPIDRTRGSSSQDASAPKNEKDFPKTIEHSVWASNTIADCVCEEVKRRAVTLKLKVEYEGGLWRLNKEDG